MDDKLRKLEKAALSDFTVPNLVKLQTARYRAGLEGIGREKLVEWWKKAHEILEEPTPIPFYNDRPGYHTLHGYFRVYQNRFNVAIRETFGHGFEKPEPFDSILRIDVSAQWSWDSLPFPGRAPVRFQFIDGDLFVPIIPSMPNYAELKKRMGWEGWPQDLLKANVFQTLEEVLDNMCEIRFLYGERDYLIGNHHQKCNNCSRPMEIRQIIFGGGGIPQRRYSYYRCVRCLGN